MVRQVHGYNRRLTGKHGHRGNILKSDTLAIGKDSNGIRVRSSCLGFHKGEERIHEEDGATQSRESSQLRNETEAIKRSKPERNKQHGKHTIINMAYDAHPSMMHVRLKCAWHGKVHKQNYKLSGAQYATSCILMKHHNKLFSSILFMYPTILNVVKHGKRVKQRKLPI